jgi:hypothetical protein
MQLSETVKLYPTAYQKNLITQTMAEYIDGMAPHTRDFSRELGGRCHQDLKGQYGKVAVFKTPGN